MTKCKLPVKHVSNPIPNVKSREMMIILKQLEYSTEYPSDFSAFLSPVKVKNPDKLLEHGTEHFLHPFVLSWGI